METGAGQYQEAHWVGLTSAANHFVYYYFKQNKTHFCEVQMLKEQQFYLLRMFRVWHSEEGGLNGLLQEALVEVSLTVAVSRWD